MKSKWTEIILQRMNQYRKYMFEAEQYIWKHPQTGFHEWDAHNYLKEKLLKLGFKVIEAVDIPGFYFDIDTGRQGPCVAVIGELDAILLPNHPECDVKTGAVHACGHHCQSSALLGIAGVLSECEILSEICGKIRIMAVPAEELIELEERSQLKKEGKIKYVSGKSEFLRRGYFDGVDIAIMLHSTDSTVPGLNIMGGTSGIIAKRVIYRGSENVGGSLPTNGVNALHAAQIAMNAINSLRESFPHNNNVRVQYIITKGGESVQLMPSEVIIEAHIRAYDYAILKNVNKKVNRAYTAAAVAVGAEVLIEDLEVTIPEDNSRNVPLAEVAYEVGCELFGAENSIMNLLWNNKNPGGTDMGNVGSVMPTIQPYLCSPGTECHKVDFHVENPEYSVTYHAVALAAMVCVLLENDGERSKKVISEYRPLFSSVKEYCEEMDRIIGRKGEVEYNKDVGARLQWD